MLQSREELLKLLEEKYAASGQNLDVHLSGLLHGKDITYWDYIQTDALLNLQIQRTNLPDEMVFIVYHQINELLFKMILWEINQVSHNKELTTSFFAERLYRISRYFDMLATSFDVMKEGMEVSQYMKFRDSLTPASGFQSAQYRLIEFASTELINLIDFRWLVEGSFEGVFEVEKSYDNNSWVSVGTIDGLGMNASEYFIEDEKPKLNQTFYRLTYHALDGEISNLGVIVINNKVEGQLSFRIIPNPTEGKEIQIVVSSNHSEAVHAYVIDAFGHIFYTGELIVLEGDQIFTLRPNLDAFGLFYVNLRSSSISLTDKVIIHK